MSASGFQILVVDDESVQREMLKGFLVKQGYGVESAEDGRRALEKFRSGSFDLVITDLRMPGMDGLQSAHRAEAARPGSRGGHPDGVCDGGKRRGRDEGRGL